VDFVANTGIPTSHTNRTASAQFAAPTSELNRLTPTFDGPQAVD
jgi:hypothetical protein